MPYPGTLLKKGATGPNAVAVIRKLAALRMDVDAAATTFDARVISAIKLFQSLHFGPDGRPLIPDGEVGPMTWGALFPEDIVRPPPAALSPIAAAALGFALTQIGVMERPPGSNRGPEVDAYNRAAGAALGSFWCMSFVHFCFLQAAGSLGVRNPFPKTAGCLDAWRRTSRMGRTLTRDDALADLSRVKPGMVFILDHGGGYGHTGFVKACIGGALRTVEGNSNPNGSSNGIGVFELNRRNVANRELKGFIDFT